MEGVTRIGVSLEPDLLAEFDKIIAKKGYVSRSEAIRDLVRDSLAETDWKNENELVCGVITMVYNHEVTGLTEKLTEMEHGANQNIYTTIHMHLNPEICMEIIAVEGKLGDLKRLSDDIGSIKGVQRCKLTMASKTTGHMHYVGLRKD
ncbi:MAG: nickel-responsive transcriptional regulator NikR [Candidatus Methanomethylophilus sp.]|jgi:CopG family nickel-responsive transcriptional regulator|nr:nickel-responsive transcriptional regulator NikR [Methanomethylophilus sp.]MCI2093480.1 nickel-responsive transcriptional regulator NikR [Methanomethylophilus sp.]MEE3400954.1 nickel-responsive transcriptional regulator NikR [Methanomethylophilus sp.]WII09155.1 nickel-responsive transcriptional regulator NikR [Methanomassiliicoccales archaeon LGM-DZ1]